jgi:hypothetical protein
MDEPKLTETDLQGVTGGGDRYRHRLGGCYTEGVQLVAERGAAYWLIDAVFSHQGNPLARREPFQVWVLSRTTGNEFMLDMNDGNNEKNVLIRQVIPFSDFPIDRIELYLVDGVLLLPSEY